MLIYMPTKRKYIGQQCINNQANSTWTEITHEDQSGDH